MDNNNNILKHGNLSEIDREDTTYITSNQFNNLENKLDKYANEATKVSKDNDILLRTVGDLTDLIDHQRVVLDQIKETLNRQANAIVSQSNDYMQSLERMEMLNATLICQAESNKKPVPSPIPNGTTSTVRTNEEYSQDANLQTPFKGQKWSKVIKNRNFTSEEIDQQPFKQIIERILQDPIDYLCAPELMSKGLESREEFISLSNTELELIEMYLKSRSEDMIHHKHSQRGDIELLTPKSSHEYHRKCALFLQTHIPENIVQLLVYVLALEDRRLKFDTSLYSRITTYKVGASIENYFINIAMFARSNRCRLEVVKATLEPEMYTKVLNSLNANGTNDFTFVIFRKQMTALYSNMEHPIKAQIALHSLNPYDIKTGTEFIKEFEQRVSNCSLDQQTETAKIAAIKYIFTVNSCYLMKDEIIRTTTQWSEMTARINVLFYEKRDTPHTRSSNSNPPKVIFKRSSNENVQVPVTTSPGNSNTNTSVRPLKQTKTICEYCEKTGHSESSCWRKYPELIPQQFKQINAVREETKKIRRLHSHSKIIPMIITDPSIDVIIDSGANVSVVPEHLVTEVSLMKINDTSISSIHGSEHLTNKALLQFSSLNYLSNTMCSFIVSCYVIKSKRNEILLGTDFLTEVNAVLDFNTNTLKGTHQSKPFIFGLKDKSINGDTILKINNEDQKDLFILERRLNRLKIDNNIQETIQEQSNLINNINQIVTDDPIPDGFIFILRRSLINKEAEIASNQSIEEKNIINLIETKYRDIIQPLEIPIYRDDLDLEFNLNGTSPLPRYYPIAQKLKDLVAIEIERQLKLGHIRSSKSNIAAPIVMVKKSGVDEYRMCVDYTEVNKVTEKLNYDLPKINDVLMDCYGYSILSKLDLTKGFNQLRVKSGFEMYTAFKSHLGTFEYLVVPFGLKNAPLYFQRTMDSMFKVLLLKKSLSIFIDDFLIKTKINDQNQHLRDCEDVFIIIQKNQLKINLNKCTFAKASVQFLGHIIGNNMVKPLHDKVESIKQWLVPRNVKELQSFLGLVGYYRKFIKNIASIEKPLFELIKKGSEFDMTSERLSAFNQLKLAMSNTSHLYLPDYGKSFHIETDASGFAIAFVLFQLKQEDAEITDENRLNITYGSKILQPAELNYTVLEKELFAIVYSLKVNYFTIFGYKIHIYTDHQNIKFIKRNGDASHINPRVVRWLTLFNSYDIELHYIPGSTNIYADALSRSIRRLKSSPVTEVVTSILPENSIINLICNGYKKEKENWITNHSSTFIKYRYCTLGLNGLYLIKDKIVLPELADVYNEVFKIAHSGHDNFTTTFNLLKERYILVGLGPKLKTFIKTCITCLLANSLPSRKYGYLHMLAPATQCFKSISMDFVSGIPKLENNDMIWVIVDRFSKYVVLIPLPCETSSAECLVLFINHYVKYFGYPNEIISDNDTRFTGKNWSIPLLALGVKLNYSLPYNPSSNGQAESYVKIVINALRRLILEKNLNKLEENENTFDVSFMEKEWLTELPMVQFNLNNSIHVSTKFTPFHIVHGFTPNSKLSLHATSKVFDTTLINQQMKKKFEYQELVRKMVHKNLISHMESTTKYNNSRFLDVQVQVGDYVFARIGQNTIAKNKLEAKLTGPYKVIQVDGLNITFVYKDVYGNSINMVETIRKLKPYKGNVTLLHTNTSGKNGLIWKIEQEEDTQLPLESSLLEGGGENESYINSTSSIIDNSELSHLDNACLNFDYKEKTLQIQNKLTEALTSDKSPDSIIADCHSSHDTRNIKILNYKLLSNKDRTSQLNYLTKILTNPSLGLPLRNLLLQLFKLEIESDNLLVPDLPKHKEIIIQILALNVQNQFIRIIAQRQINSRDDTHHEYLVVLSNSKVWLHQNQLKSYSPVIQTFNKYKSKFMDIDHESLRNHKDTKSNVVFRTTQNL